MRRIALTWWVDGEERAGEFPAKFEVCEQCEGEGSVLNPAIAEHAYTREEFLDAFPDEEERAHYFAGGRGMYGVCCPACKGEKIVLTADTESFTEGEKAAYSHFLASVAEETRERDEEAHLRRYEDGFY